VASRQMRGAAMPVADAIPGQMGVHIQALDISSSSTSAASRCCRVEDTRSFICSRPVARRWDPSARVAVSQARAIWARPVFFRAASSSRAARMRLPRFCGYALIPPPADVFQSLLRSGSCLSGPARKGVIGKLRDLHFAAERLRAFLRRAAMNFEAPIGKVTLAGNIALSSSRKVLAVRQINDPPVRELTSLSGSMAMLSNVISPATLC